MRIAVLAGSAGALAVAAGLWGCVPPNARAPDAAARLTAVARLDCPDSVGRLVRTSLSADAKACGYADGHDAQVQVQLAPVTADPQSTLNPIEASLRQMASFSPADSGASADASPASPSPPGEPKRNVNIDLPGLHVHASDSGRTDVNVGGIHINADDKTNSAHIQSEHGGFMGHGGGFTIDANHSGAIIRSQSMGPDVRQSLILASDKPGPDGWRVVGYEAVGPRSGPLVIAVVQSRSDEHDQLFGDVRALVRRIAGG